MSWLSLIAILIVCDDMFTHDATEGMGSDVVDGVEC